MFIASEVDFSFFSLEHLESVFSYSTGGRRFDLHTIHCLIDCPMLSTFASASNASDKERKQRT